jgi:hypothetical protein
VGYYSTAAGATTGNCTAAASGDAARLADGTHKRAPRHARHTLVQKHRRRQRGAQQAPKQRQLPNSPENDPTSLNLGFIDL